MRVTVVLLVVGLWASAATLDPSLLSPANSTIGAPLKAVAVEGTVYTLSDARGVAASGIVFLGTQCPISNKYIPDLNTLAKTARVFGVISDPSVTREAAVKYVAEYKIAFPVLFDASGELARHLGPKVTPEAFVLDRHGQVRYRGQIDDSWADLRRQKPVAASHAFADALAAVAAGKTPTTPQAAAIGCTFEAWDSQPKNAPVTYARAPGDSHYVRTASISTPRDVTLHGIIPHMHLVGRQMRVTAKKPDGTEIRSSGLRTGISDGRTSIATSSR